MAKQDKKIQIISFPESSPNSALGVLHTEFPRIPKLFKKLVKGGINFLIKEDREGFYTEFQAHATFFLKAKKPIFREFDFVVDLNKKNLKRVSIYKPLDVVLLDKPIKLLLLYFELQMVNVVQNKIDLRKVRTQ